MKALLARATVILALILAGCVQTGDTRSEPNYEEAARINTQLGLDYLRMGRYVLAQQKLEKALKQDDSLAQTHMGLALVHARFEEFDSAEGYFRTAMKMAPQDPTVLNNYGAFLCERDRADEAEALFVEALQNRRYRTPEVAYSNAGACYLKAGNLDQAERYLRQALQVNPEAPNALLQMAALSYQREDYLRARAFLQRYEAKTQPGLDGLLLGLRTEFALGDQQAAQVYADRLRSQRPDAASRYNLVTGQPW